MMGALGGGGGAPDPYAQAFGSPEAPAGAAGGDNVSHLQQALEHLLQYANAEDDEIHTQTALQCLAKLQSILADEQKQGDELLQGKATPRSLRRATSGQGY